MVGVEPVAGEEHGEKKDDPDVGPEDFPETQDLGLPGGVFHQDHARPISSNDIAGIDEGPSEASTQKGHDHEADVGSIGNSAS